ncbi:LacI family DNA-binding transcriptional regulator [Neorhizobium sp. NPDC001467]|uniref:LacI family DNA-binding transcriptional regulator n=1 Tax=Neorhizobium sp. NPDC001467 TaxID=3390595 RepID=UPI003D0658B9
MNKRFATLDDVAAAAGLSRSHVSRALSNHPGVTPETRLHIQNVANRIGYRPNLAARNLASTRTRNIGIMIGEPFNPFQMLLAQQVDIALGEAGYDAVVSLRAYHEGPVLSEAERLRELRVAGIICISTPHEDETIRRIADMLPCVYIGKEVDDERVYTVTGADRVGVSTTVAHLISSGHKDIAFISGGSSPGSARRLDGYRDAMSAASLTPREIIGGATLAVGRESALKLMGETPRPTAIIAHNDLVAMGAAAAVQEWGLKVPDDVSLVGFDDIPYAAADMLSLTTLRQDPATQARAAVAAMLHLLEDGDPVARSQLLPVELQLRRSIAPRP